MIKVLLLLIVLVNSRGPLGPIGPPIQYLITYRLFGDQLIGLGVERIKMAMIMADNWRAFEVKWKRNVWPEDVLEDLANNVNIAGFMLTRWKDNEILGV